MFRLVFTSNALPMSYPIDPSATFQAGAMLEPVIIGNQVMLTVSNGTCPIGVVDDIRTKAFSNVSWNEEVLVPAYGVPGPNNTIVTPVDIKVDLRKPNIVPSSFTSTVAVSLNPINGTVCFLAGTQLNIDLQGTGQPSGIKSFVNYTYMVANIPGDDSTAGTGRVTVWYDRMIFETDMFETNQQYPLRANLYCSEVGQFTTRKPNRMSPAVGIVFSPPSTANPMLQVFWF